MSEDLSYYCRVYDNFLTHEECDAFIENYETTIKEKARAGETQSMCTLPSGESICPQCNCYRLMTFQHDRFDYLNKLVMPKFTNLAKQYKSDCVQSYMWPKKYGWEKFRMKRYRVAKEEQFKNHVDVTSHAVAKRFLVFTCYLNDNFGDGHTTFPVFGKSIKPKKGSVLVFPPLWTFLHRADTVSYTHLTLPTNREV